MPVYCPPSWTCDEISHPPHPPAALGRSSPSLTPRVHPDRCSPRPRLPGCVVTQMGDLTDQYITTYEGDTMSISAYIQDMFSYE